MSRTRNSLMNIGTNVIGQILQMLLQFVSRTIFVQFLSEEYLGINGLFGNILNLLSLTELGFGTAIIYSLYKPIAENDEKHITQLMNMYRRIYSVVAFAILGIGLLLVPFLDYFIAGESTIPNLRLLYILYLLNTVFSYFLIYKRSLIEANQKQYICTIYQKFFSIVQNIVQIVVLFATRNYILYLVVMIFCNIMTNICISRKADCMYPWLKQGDKSLPDKTERIAIYKNTLAMSMHKLGTVCVNSTDNILMSALVSLGSVGIYSNYTLITGNVSLFVGLIYNSLTASIGNLGADCGKQKLYDTYRTLNFCCFIITSFCTLCLFSLLNPFLTVWLGEKYIFNMSVVSIITLNYYLSGMRQMTLKFRDALGIFWYDRYKAVAEAVINLVCSVVLTKIYGIIGIFIGTTICNICVNLWVEPHVLYKYGFQQSSKEYYLEYGKYTLFTLGIAAVLYMMNQILTGAGVILFCGRGILTVFIYVIAFVSVFLRNEQLKNLLSILLRMINRKRKTE
nr:oligosaccharide flippase family protein [uncultured Anaerobutyricum sp.]